MRNRVRFIAAIAVVIAALLFLGVALYWFVQPDVVTTEMGVQTLTVAAEITRHSHDGASWMLVGAVGATGVAALIAAAIGGEMDRE